MCFFSTAVDFTTPLMITDALWVSYVTRNAFLNALASFFSILYFNRTRYYANFHFQFYNN